MGPEAVAALVGAGAGAVVGFALGFVGEWIREARRESGDARAASRMIVAEMIANISTIDAARLGRSWDVQGNIRQFAWDAYGAAVVRHVKWHEIGLIARAYTAAHDAVWAMESDMSDEDKEEVVDRLFSELVVGLRQGMLLAGESRDDVERRLGAALEMSKQARDVS